MGHRLHASIAVVTPIVVILFIELRSGQGNTLLRPGSGRSVYLSILGTEVFLAHGIWMILIRNPMTSHTRRD